MQVLQCPSPRLTLCPAPHSIRGEASSAEVEKVLEIEAGLERKMPMLERRLLEERRAVLASGGSEASLLGGAHLQHLAQLPAFCSSPLRTPLQLPSYTVLDLLPY